MFLKKYIAIINHSAYPEDHSPVADDKARAIYRLVYQQLNFIAVREPISLEIVKAMDIPATLSLHCLPLYIREYYQPIKEQPTNNVVIAGSANWDGINSSALIDYIQHLDEQGFKIQLLTGAQTYTPKDSQLVSFLDDDKIIDFFSKHFSNINWQLIDAQSMNQWLDTIANAKMLVSGRFHHSIAACCLKTPFIALETNTPKLQGFMQLLEMPKPLQYEDHDLLNQLIRKTEMALSLKMPQVSQQDVERLQALAENNFEGINTFGMTC